MNVFYGRLQRIALLPVVIFLWSGLADEVLGWPGVLPFGLGAAQRPSLLAVLGTWIELLAPLGLLFSRSRPTASLVLSVYAIVLAFVFHPFWSDDDGAHHELQSFLLCGAIAGVLLFIFAASRLHDLADPSGTRPRLTAVMIV